MGDSRRALRYLLAALVALLAGCAANERIILLPEHDGGPTSVVVRQGDREMVLDRPYAAAELSLADPWRYSATPEEVQSTFGAALAAQPTRAAHFTLYFVEGSDDLTEDSKQLLESMFADLAKRAVADVLVVGHTDAVGSDQYNDALATKRAQAVRSALIARGIPAEDVVAFGRGKRELLVPTPDGFAEPRNRRVEIVVR
ncbi:MAG TPA: OmpA family protein [Casimicrobiaceae bacterium]|nr:OmpA family protein [Casimicrobiaceae bacterium]